MKQTSSAITFLMAQYRAIFKHAYIKGLASAVILTAGLAAGASQAADTEGLNWGTANDTTNDITISGTATVGDKSSDYYAHDITITGFGNFTIGSGTAGPRVVVNNNLTLQNGATLTVNNGASGLIGSHNVAAAASGDNFAVYDGADTTFTANNSTIKVQSGSSIIFVRASITDSTVTLESGAGIGAEPGRADRTGDRGQLTLDGGTYDLAESAWLYGNNVTVTEGTVINAQSGDSTETSNIFAKSTGALNFAGTLNVASGGAALLGGGAVNIQDGAVIESSGTLILGNGYGQVTIEDGSEINHVNASDHIYAGQHIVMEGGTLNLANPDNGTAGWGLIGTEEANTASENFIYDLTANSGVISLNKSQIQMRNVTLGGDVEVTIGGNIGDNSNSNWADNSQINAIGTGETGVLTVTGKADITMQAGSLMTANQFNLDGGSIELQGAANDDATNTSNSGTAMIRGYGDGIMNLAGTSLNVAADKAGVLRSKDINLTASTITNAGVLTIAGSVNNKSGGNTVVVGTDFDMTGGSLNNAAGGVLHLGLDGVDNSGSVFTIAGGTFTNAGTTNVASGSTLTLTGTTTAAPTISNTGTISVTSGGTFETSGYVTVGGAAGKIDFASGSTGILGGEDTFLNGSLSIASGSNVSVTGKVTFNGDGSSASGDKVDITGSGDLNIADTGTLIIKDAGNTIGLNYSEAAAGDSGVGTFTTDSGFAGFKSDAAGILYLDVSNIDKLGGTTIATSDMTEFAEALKSGLNLSGATTSIKIEGVTFDYGDAIDSTTNSADFSDVEDALASGVSDGQLDNAQIKVTTGDANVQGSLGSVNLSDTAGTSVTVGTKTPLVLNGYESQAGESQGTALVTAGSGADATVGGAELQAGSVITIAAENGTIGAVTTQGSATNTGTFNVQAGSNLTVVTAGTKADSVKDGVAEDVVRGDIGARDAKLNSVNVGGSLDVKDIYTTNLNLTTTATNVAAEDIAADNAAIMGTLSAQNITSTNFSADANSNLTVADTLSGDTIALNGTSNIDTIEATSSLTFAGGNHNVATEVVADGELVVDQQAAVTAANVEANQGLSVVGDATLTVESLKLGVGDLKVGTAADNGTGGTLSALFLNLNGNDLVVDPPFGEAASVVAVAKISNSASDTDAEVNGSIYALRNSIVALGTDDEQLVKDIFAPYLDATGSLSNDADGVGAVAYIHSAQTIANGEQIVVDKTQTDATLDKTGYTDDITLGANSVLAINVDAARDGAALTFNTLNQDDATISAAAGSKVVLTGEYSSSDTLTLFADNGTTTGIDLATGTNSLRIETLNGLLYKEHKSTDGSLGQIAIEDMDIDTTRVATAYTDTSSAVRNSILSYVTGDSDWANHGKQDHNIDASRIHGARVDGVTYNGTNFIGSDGQTIADTTKTDNWTYVLNPAYVDATETPDVPQYLAYEKANNPLLTAIREQTETRGAAADSAAHMSEFGGAAQVALKAGAATTDAIAGRMGMGAANNAITYANNGQGAGIWVTPIYMSADSDGFDAQGVDYGTDISLYGVALGGDYTLANGVRVGAMFNVGSGDADGQGAGSAVTSDFDYYGLGLYAGYSFGQFSVVGDISYTSVDNDIEAGSGFDTIGTMKTSLDSTNLSIGVTGAYAFESASGVKVTPHVGLRYSNIDLDDYTVESSAGTIGSYDSDSLSVFSIPVGVTVATEFTTGTWSIKPSFDVTITGQFGDDEAEGTFKWAGVENIDSHLNSEIFDSFTYGATLGVAAQSASGISLGLAVGYTGSSNTDDLGVSANARFTF